MRPGQTAPVFRPRHCPIRLRALRGFNEAGADCPGIPGEEWRGLAVAPELQ